MKSKYISRLSLALMMCAFVFSSFQMAPLTEALASTRLAGNPTTRLYVNPPSIIDPEKTPGTQFTVDVNVENVLDLYTWAFELHWDPALLNVTSVVEGPFLAEVAPEGTFFIDKRYQEAGYIDEACTILGPYPGAEGNGTLLTVTFLVEKVGETTLDLSQTQLIDSKTPPGQISHTVDDGYFCNLPPRIYVDPEKSTAKPSSTFTINITVADVTDLYRLDFRLIFNATLLDATSVTEGPFLKSGGSTTFYFVIDTFQNATGSYKRIYYNETLLGSVPGVSGNGTVASITLIAQTTGGASLDLCDTKLLNSSLIELPHATFDGYFSNKPPIADFVIITPPEHRIVDKMIMFDAPPSICFDPDGEIVSYKWDFGDGNSTTKTAPDTSAINIYKWAGVFNVNLTVTDNDGLTGTVINPIIIKINSTITISVSPTTITLGQSTTISGSITPSRPGALVTIYYREIEFPILWFNLTTVKTDQDSHYTYTWTPTTVGNYAFYPHWDGDESTAGAGDPYKGPFASVEVLSPVQIYTDKYSYSAGDTMYLGLSITNPLDRTITVCIAIWIEFPDGSTHLLGHAHGVTLPARFHYSNPDFKTFVLPSIPPGVYTWHAAFLNPATHKILIEDTAEWQFV